MSMLDDSTTDDDSIPTPATFADGFDIGNRRVAVHKPLSPAYRPLLPQRKAQHPQYGQPKSHESGDGLLTVHVLPFRSPFGC